MSTNRFQIIGTAITPFVYNIKGSIKSYVLHVETCKYNRVQNIPVTFFLKKTKDQIFDFSRDLSGKQVAITGYIQGTAYKAQDGRWIDYLYIVGRELCVISSPTKEEKAQTYVEDGIYLDETDLPI